jgi:hypothetical protein
MDEFDYDYLANFWMLQEELYLKEQEKDDKQSRSVE